MTPESEWTSAEHASRYLSRADRIPHRAQGEAALLEFLPPNPSRILDLGTGDGRLLAMALIGRPRAQGVALDFSPPMLDAARQRFAANPNVTVVDHNLDLPLPPLGQFDAVISSFAIHHCDDARKEAIYREVHALLAPGGVFCNLEHVMPASPDLHARFIKTLGISPADEDPSNKLAPVALQLHWLRQIGYTQVDCHWKYLELALLAGFK